MFALRGVKAERCCRMLWGCLLERCGGLVTGAMFALRCVCSGECYASFATGGDNATCVMNILNSWLETITSCKFIII